MDTLPAAAAPPPPPPPRRPGAHRRWQRCDVLSLLGIAPLPRRPRP